MGFIRNHLRVLMAENKLNIQKVKEQTTLSRTTISNLYNSYSAGVQFDTMEQLCKLLECQPGDLFEYVDVDVILNEINEDMRLIKQVKLDEDSLFEKQIELRSSFMFEMIFEGDGEIFTFNIHAYMNVSGSLVDDCEIVLSNEYVEELGKLKIQNYLEPYITSQVQEQLVKNINKVLNLNIKKSNVQFNIG
ncbi:helix-turn-helix domain-containing protein [Terribacillus saccharophilus]